MNHQGRVTGPVVGERGPERDLQQEAGGARCKHHAPQQGRRRWRAWGLRSGHSCRFGGWERKRGRPGSASFSIANNFARYRAS